MPEQGTRPVNKYLPPRDLGLQSNDRGGGNVVGPPDGSIDVLAPLLEPVAESPSGLLGWIDRTLSKL